MGAFGCLGDFESKGRKIVCAITILWRFPDVMIGRGGILRQVALRISADFHRPSWQALRHHCLAVKAQKKLFRQIEELGDNDKKDEFKQDRMSVGQLKDQ